MVAQVAVTRRQGAIDDLKHGTSFLEDWVASRQADDYDGEPV
jgi:hypothetical protein